MSDNDRKPNETDATSQGADDTNAGGPAEPSSFTSLDPFEDPSAFGMTDEQGGSGPQEDRVAELERALAETKDQLLRALADAENVRKRAQRDVADARQYAMAGFARDMLNVADNFERAMQSRPDPEKVAAAGLDGLMGGIEATHRELLNVLERHGIRTLDPVGERFDPKLHQAMFEVENPDVPSGTVVQVVQKGNMIGERILRPAMVGVSKGGPKPTAQAEAQREPAEGQDSSV